jgi:hypothetical protein
MLLSLQLLDANYVAFSFGENLPHFAMLAIRAALGLVKDFQRSFLQGSESQPRPLL